jgi:CheY-like chemotaxis protein
MQLSIENGVRVMQFNKIRLLYAEDNDLNAEILTELLDKKEYQVKRVVNGKECVIEYDNAPEGYYDAIIMDIMMPVMNGYEATRQIRCLNKPEARRIPIIALSCQAFDEDIMEALASGMNAHVAKPININKFILQLKTLLVK